MKNYYYGLLLVGMLLFNGCPYNSKVELNTYEESIKLDKTFYGDWISFHEDGSHDDIQIEKGMKNVYNVRHTPYDSSGKKEDYNYYRAYITEIGGVNLANLEKKDGNYNFYKVNFTSPDEIVLSSVGEDFVKANYEKAESPDTKSLRAFIEQNIGVNGLFEEALHFYRKGSDACNTHKN